MFVYNPLKLLIVCFRYASKELPIKPTCTHKDIKLQCSAITMIDLQNFHKSFYAINDKVKQDAYILKHVIAVKTKRRRPRNNSIHYKPRSMQMMYRVYSRSQKKMIFVCQKSFLQILHIKRYRIKNVVKNYYLSGNFPKENRGGDHRSHKYLDKKQSIISFIKTFKCSEPHYYRGSTKRMYLPAELSINKMSKIYNNQAVEHLKVKPLYFRQIFNTSFNLGFGSPRLDVCSTCLQLTEKLKSASESDKTRLMAEKTVHKRRAQAFFTMLKAEDPSLKILSFDCQKNMALPKIPDQSTYYCRQLYFYNFTIVEGHSKSPLTKENVFSYCWTEDEYAKDANLIVSAVYHRLHNTAYLPECNKLRIMADGCSGQNKNTMLIAMLSMWLIQDAPAHIKLVEIVFPVVGHSFLPADRVFARIEKELRKMENIISPREYMKVVSEHSTTINVASTCQVLDWKSAAKDTFLNVGKCHVPFAKCKRFYLKRASRSNQMVGLRGELHYKQDLGTYKNISKKDKTSAMIAPTVISQGVTVKQLKLRDVNKLLNAHYGDNWRNLDILGYFARVVPQDTTIENNNDDRHDDNTDELMCEEQEELPSLII